MPWGLPWWSNDEESACQRRKHQSQVWEDPTWHEATKPACHIYCSPGTTEPVLCNKRSHCNEKPEHNDKDPAQPKKEKSWNKPMMNPDCWDLIVALQFGILLFKTELKDRAPSKANGCFTG